MTEEQKPVEVQSDSPPEVVQKEQEDILPDASPDTNLDKVKELENKRIEVESKLKEVEKERDQYAIRLKDNQEYISRTRNFEKENVATEIPKKSFNEYVDDVLKKFEDDPKEGIKKIITDVAFDRDLERQEYEKRITDSENRAFKRVLSLDPEKAKIVKSVEKLDQDRPDLSYLSFEHKVEWLNKNSTDERRRESQIKVDRERDLAGDVAGRASPDKGERLPDWVNDREVQSRAKEHFASKKELADWGDSNKAKEMAKKLRPKYING